MISNTSDAENWTLLENLVNTMTGDVVSYNHGVKSTG